MNYFDKFQPGQYYHIFNHAVGKENLFQSDDNYDFFLTKFHQYLSPVCKTFCYCLMPNHFHFLVQMREEEILRLHVKCDYTFDFDHHKFIMQQLSNFLNSYAKSFNKQQSRKGALFLDYTRRREITSDYYLTTIVNYIHQNPVRHNFCKSITNWKYSSYNEIINIDKISKLERDLIFDWFGGREEFIRFHYTNL